MTRSIWKGPYSAMFITDKNRQRSPGIRKSTILPSHIGKIFQVYNGIKFISVRVTSQQDMVGRKFGEFAVPRKALGTPSRTKTTLKKSK